jgi:hypothetical protein
MTTTHKNFSPYPTVSDSAIKAGVAAAHRARSEAFHQALKRTARALARSVSVQRHRFQMPSGQARVGC